MREPDQRERACRRRCVVAGVVRLVHRVVRRHATVEAGGQGGVPDVRQQAPLRLLRVLEVQRRDGQWHVVPDSRWARHWTALGPEIEMSGPAAGSEAMHGRSKARGTLANCAGGVTPWHTVTTCEEN